MQATPAKTAVLYALAGLAAGRAMGYPKMGAAIGLGLGLRAPKKGSRILDASGDPRDLSRSALGVSEDYITAPTPPPTSFDWRAVFGKSRSSRLRQGDLAGSPYANAPKIARTLGEARLAAAYAYKIGKGSRSSISALEKSGPWSSKKTITGIIDKALASGVGRDSRAYLIGVRLRSKGVTTPGVSTKGKYRTKSGSSPSQPGSPIPRPAPTFFSPDAGSGPGQTLAAQPWYKNKMVMIGAGILGTGLVLVLVMGGRKR
jgi:hypothetical protein